MSNSKKGSIVYVQSPGVRKVMCCVIRRFTGDCGDKMMQVSVLDDGEIRSCYEEDVSDFIIQNIFKFKVETT